VLTKDKGDEEHKNKERAQRQIKSVNGLMQMQFAYKGPLSLFSEQRQADQMMPYRKGNPGIFQQHKPG
jgi:hypothetical protein